MKFLFLSFALLVTSQVNAADLDRAEVTACFTEVKTCVMQGVMMFAAQNPELMQAAMSPRGAGGPPPQIEVKEKSCYKIERVNVYKLRFPIDVKI